MNDLIHVVFLQMGGLSNTCVENNLRRTISVLQERRRTHLNMLEKCLKNKSFPHLSCLMI